MADAVHPARRRLPGILRIQRQRHHHHRTIRRPAPSISAFVHFHDLAEVQPLDHIQQEQRQATFRQPLAHVRWQQQLLIQMGCAEDVPHLPPLRFANAFHHSLSLTDGLVPSFSSIGSSVAFLVKVGVNEAWLRGQVRTLLELLEIPECGCASLGQHSALGVSAIAAVCSASRQAKVTLPFGRLAPAELLATLR